MKSDYFELCPLFKIVLCLILGIVFGAILVDREFESLDWISAGVCTSLLVSCIVVREKSVLKSVIVMVLAVAFGVLLFATSDNDERLQSWETKERTELVNVLIEKNSYLEDVHFITSISMGERSGLSKEFKDDYSRAGVVHVLALSGLHLSIIYTFISITLLPLMRRILSLEWAKYTSQFVVLLLIWMYVIVVGMPVGAVRAALMITVYSVVSVIGDKPQPLNTLSLAAIIVLVANPMTLWNVGFQLSFVSVLFILLMYKPLMKMLPKAFVDTKICKSIYSLFAVSFAAQIGTIPLILYYFGRFPTYFLFSNILVVPLVTIILNISIVYIALSLCGFLIFMTEVLQEVLHFLISLLNEIVVIFSHLPFGAIDGVYINIWQVIIYYIVVACVCGVYCRYKLPKIVYEK